jgi:hypothetical protein
MLSAISLETCRWFESFSLLEGWRRVKPRLGVVLHEGKSDTPQGWRIFSETFPLWGTLFLVKLRELGDVSVEFVR